MKAAKLLTMLLLLVGGSLCARALYLHAKAELAGVLIRRAWEHSLQSGQSHKPWPWADTHPVARLQIPRLGYDEIVLEGATPRTLAFGPAHMLSGAGFGEPGNLLLAGHRTSWFRSLEGIRDGDTVLLDSYDARRHAVRHKVYTVQLTRVIDPHDTALLAPTTDDALTLITCYPFGARPTSPQRFVVRAAPADTTTIVTRSLP
jgi:sortase A